MIPEPEPIWIPPPAPGSGKFETPWERMQSENLIPADCAVDLELSPEAPDEPHAVSAAAQPATTSQTSWRRHALSVALRWSLPMAIRFGLPITVVAVVAPGA